MAKDQKDRKENIHHYSCFPGLGVLLIRRLCKFIQYGFFFRSVVAKKSHYNNKAGIVAFMLPKLHFKRNRFYKPAGVNFDKRGNIGGEAAVLSRDKTTFPYRL